MADTRKFDHWSRGELLPATAGKSTTTFDFWSRGEPLPVGISFDAGNLLVGSIVGTSATSGTLAAIFALAAGTSAGLATVTGTLKATALLAGSTAGLATTSGKLTAPMLIAGSASGLATVTGTLNGSTQTFGTSFGTSSASGSLTAYITLAGASGGTSTASGTMEGSAALAGASFGSSSAEATIIFDDAGAGTGSCVGTSECTGTLKAFWSFASNLLNVHADDLARMVIERPARVEWLDHKFLLILVFDCVQTDLTRTDANLIGGFVPSRRARLHVETIKFAGMARPNVDAYMRSNGKIFKVSNVVRTPDDVEIQFDLVARG